MVLNIEEIYSNYIKKQNEAERAKIPEMPGFMSASSAGLCLLKHLYKIEKYEAEPVDAKTERVFRLGKLVHDDIQKALEDVSLDKLEVEIEHSVRMEEYGVRGYIDVSIINHEEKMVDVLELKTMHSFRWKKKFGYARNRDKNPAEHNELQLATYTIAKMQELKGYLPRMYLFYYKKDDSSIKVYRIKDSFLNKALNYWKEAKDFIENEKVETAQPGFTYGCPMFIWECKRCQYAMHCSSPHK